MSPTPHDRPAARRAERGKLSARLCAGRINQVETIGGGTSPTVGTVSPSFVPQCDLTAPFANANGQVAAPNVDLAHEAVQQIVTRYEFAANATVVQVASEIMKTLLDIKT